MRWILCVALLLTACSSQDASPQEETPTTTMYTLQGELGPSFTDCINLPHSRVVVTDESGTVIGTTTASGDTNGPGNGCVIEFTVEVPEADFYTLRIGSHDGPTYSRTELEEASWTVHLSLS